MISKMPTMSAPIIITVPNNYLAVDKVESGPIDGPALSRKRKLDHLSWEEKMQRKKLKNRVAAQTSRDRKKAKMDEMEHRIQQLEDVNTRLVSEMASMKALNSRLLEENESLRRNADARTVPGARRPAESPQQKEGLPAAVRATRLLLAMCLISTSSLPLSPTTVSTLSTNSLTPSSKRLMEELRHKLTKPLAKQKLNSVLKEMKWWGAHQSMWNPVKVEG